MNERTIAQQSTDPEYIDDGEKHIQVAKRKIALITNWKNGSKRTYNQIAKETGYTFDQVSKDISRYKRDGSLCIPSRINYLKTEDYQFPPDRVAPYMPPFVAAHMENLREKERQAWEGREATRIAEIIGAKDMKRLW